MVLPTQLPNVSEKDKEKLKEHPQLYDEMKNVFKNPCDIIKCNKLVNGLLENRKLRTIIGTLFALLLLIVILLLFHLAKKFKKSRRKGKK